MPLRFRKELIALERYESAAFVDVDRDGVPDIVSGAWWYKGPDFKRAFRIYDAPAAGEYYDDFSSIALDITGNGYPDIVTGGWWGDELRWLENPGPAFDRPWTVHALRGVGHIETTIAADLDGDGVVEILPNTPGRGVTAYKARGGALAPFPLSADAQGHGLGVGDVAGHGRLDIILNRGWLENPGVLAGPWAWHPDFELGDMAGVPILCEDVDGDGRRELVVGQGHGYGLDWWRREDDGWTRRPIDPFNAQYHCLRWLDLDGDGRPELVAGKRHRAHCGNDTGEFDPVGLYYFKWTGEGFAKQVIDYGYEPPLSGKGCGIQFDLADLDGRGLPSLVAPGKDGLFLFRNLGVAPNGRA